TSPTAPGDWAWGWLSAAWLWKCTAGESGWRASRGRAPVSASPCRYRQAPERRSEEHTSELQSRENLVCRLLLEKKNYQSAPMTQHKLLAQDGTGAAQYSVPSHVMDQASTMVGTTEAQYCSRSNLDAPPDRLAR